MEIQTMAWINHSDKDPWKLKGKEFPKREEKKRSIKERIKDWLIEYFDDPLTDEERAELEYLRDLHRLSEDMRTSLIVMKDVDKKVHRIQSFLRLKDDMSWNDYRDYGEIVGKEFKESIRKR